MSQEKIEYEIGSGNVFKDLGFPNPEEELMKARLASFIYHIITETGIKKNKAAKIMDISKKELSTLLKGRLADYSLDQLLSLLGKLDHNMKKDRINIEKGSGNIYKDLSNSHPEDMNAKAHIVFKIEDSISARKLSLDEASQIMNITETELSDIVDGLFRNLSLNQLESLFAKLEHGIENIHQNKPSKSTNQERRITSSAD